MNVLLNNYCNLKCEYCFANDVLNDSNENMTMANFKKVLDFSIKSNVDGVRLIGGEPTLHPQFLNFIMEAGRRDEIRHVHVFTNGTFGEEIAYALKLLAQRKRVSLLINYNHPMYLTAKQNENIQNNLKMLSGVVDLRLGINIYQEDQDYEYLIDDCIKYGIKSVRWSLVVPNTTDKASESINAYFKRHFPLIKRFIKDCVDNGLDPYVDCNNIPICMMDDEYIRYLSMVSPQNLKTSHCNPVIDVKPNLDVFRCFVMSDETDCYKKLDEFKDMRDIDEYFKRNIDNHYNGKPLLNACTQCPSYKQRNRSCACLAYNKNKR